MDTSTASFSMLSLITKCLAGRYSPDARVRRGRVEKYPASMRLPAQAQDVIKAAQTRFRLVLRDLCDYGTRRDYNFSLIRRTRDEKKELDWLEGRFGPDMRLEQKRTVARSEANISEPFEPDVRRRSLGECIVCAVEGFNNGDMEEWILHWLCVDMGYNLDWLFFGLGPMCAEWNESGHEPHTTPPPETHCNPGTGAVVYEDMTALRERQNMSLWSFTDWQWLLNLRAVVKAVYKAPTIPLLTRLVSGWRIPTQLPQMPHILAWLDWLAVWCIHEFIEGESAPGWKQEAIEYLATARNSGLLILGLGGQAGTQYRSSKAEPTTCVLRLAWMVRMIIDRRGREGFLDYLDMVNDEARARGFESLIDVFHQRTWSTPSRPFRKTVQQQSISEDEARELAAHNVPWGVPKEAALSPLELIALVQSGGIEMDPDPDVAWQPQPEAQAAGESESPGPAGAGKGTSRAGRAAGTQDEVMMEHTADEREGATSNGD